MDRRVLALLALFTTSLWTASSARAAVVVIREIMYHPLAGPEYFVLENISRTPFDIAGWRITAGVSFEFPEFASHNPAATILKAGERIVVSSETEAATRAACSVPATLRIFGPWKGRLSNDGERLTVSDKNDVVVCSVKYGARDRWPTSPDGTGRSLVLVDPDRRAGDWRNWSASAGAVREASVAKAELARSLASLPVSPLTPALSPLRGEGEAPGGFGGRSPSGGRAPLTAREAGTRRDASALSATPSATPSPLNGERAGVRGEKTETARMSLTIPGAQRPAAEQRPQSSVVIHEIMFDPPSAHGGCEYVELFNRGSSEVDLSDWAFCEGIRFQFPPGTKLPPGGFLVVAGNLPRFREIYGDVPVAGEFAGRLKNEGDLIRLVDRAGNVVNEVDLGAGRGWPELARGGGSSLELINPWMDNRRPSAWAASDESGKGAWVHYGCTNLYRELDPVGAPSDFRELQLHLAGAGHVILRNVVLLVGGTNCLAPADRLSTNGAAASGWLCQGTHWASFVTNAELHLIADGPGDERANRAELDAPGLRAGQICQLQFDARWISGSPRLIVETWDRSLSQSFLVARPVNLGTPGRANSRALPDPPPQVDDLQHFPAVPRSTDAVRVTARVASAGLLASVQLFHRADSATADGPWRSTPMFDDGVHGADTVAGDGMYTAVISDYRTNGQVVQFFVRATPTASACVAEAPRAGAAAPALFVVDDRPLPRNLRPVRLVLSARDLDALADGNTARHGFRFPRLSGHYFNATFITDESQVIYGAGVRNSGSALQRSGDLHKVKLRLPEDQSFRGHTKLVYDDDAAEGRAYHNRVVRYLLYLLGHPANENEFVRLVVNARPSVLREEVEPVDEEFLDRNFAEGRRGELYRIDDDWRFLDSEKGVSRDATWAWRGDDASAYRHAWLKRTGRTQDDFSSLAALFAILAHTNDPPAELDQWLDAGAVAKHAAVRGYIGDWDTFTMQAGRNAYLYRRPSDGRFQFLHWDSDEAFMTGPPLYGDRLKPWIDRPENRRLLFYHVLELMRLCAQDTARLAAWLEAQREAAGPEVFQANYLKFFQTRTAEVRKAMAGNDKIPFQVQIETCRTQIAPCAPELPPLPSVSPAGGGEGVRRTGEGQVHGQDVQAARTANGESISLTGQAPYSVLKVAIANHPEGSLEWVSDTQWTLSGLRVRPVEAQLCVQALDHRGQILIQAAVPLPSTVWEELEERSSSSAVLR